MLDSLIPQAVVISVPFMHAEQFSSSPGRCVQWLYSNTTAECGVIQPLQEVIPENMNTVIGFRFALNTSCKAEKCVFCCRLLFCKTHLATSLALCATDGFYAAVNLHSRTCFVLCLEYKLVQLCVIFKVSVALLLSVQCFA